MHIYADQISQVTFSNNNLHITLTQQGPDNSTVEAGTLILPGNQASNIVNSLAGSLKQLDERIKTQGQETEGGTQ